MKRSQNDKCHRDNKFCCCFFFVFLFLEMLYAEARRVEDSAIKKLALSHTALIRSETNNLLNISSFSRRFLLSCTWTSTSQAISKNL